MHYNISFLHLEYNNLCVHLYHPYSQTIKQKVYLLSEHLDQLNDLNIYFLVAFLI